MHHVRVSKCEVTNCCYNHDRQCHALAIQVGDVNRAECDTFTQMGAQCGIKDMTAEVGACKVTDCKFNNSLLCDAAAVDVGWKEDSAWCLTFQPRH